MAGKDLTLLALPALHIANQKEAWKVVELRDSSTYFPYISSLVPREELIDPVKPFPCRRVADTLEMVLHPWSASPATPVQPAPADVTMMTLYAIQVIKTIKACCANREYAWAQIASDKRPITFNKYAQKPQQVCAEASLPGKS